MKKNFLLIFMVSVLFTGCHSFHDYVVESDYSYKSNFKKYKTYGYMIESNPDPYTTQNTELIRKSVDFRMKLLGYKFSDKKPDLLLNYKIFNSNFEFQGYNQLKIEDWLKQEEEDEEYDPIKYKLSNGTLLIQFVDNRRRSIVWQGYASGINPSSYASNDRIIRNAVISIFDQFKVFALGYSIENPN
ncbi:MAG: DUF4136 domain-containing protein [Microscillaceae bacterium]|nr:DUF4136 domain-containing protein [Microscillaceae bacterium]